MAFRQFRVEDLAAALGGGAFRHVFRRRDIPVHGAVRSGVAAVDVERVGVQSFGGDGRTPFRLTRPGFHRFRLDGVGFGGFGKLRLLGQERLLIGDGNLIVIGMDFAEGEESVALAAEIDEHGLERRFYPDDFGKVDIAFELLLGGGFKIEFFEVISACDDHPGFLRMGRVNQHAFDHIAYDLKTLQQRPASRADGAASFVPAKPPAPLLDPPGDAKPRDRGGETRGGQVPALPGPASGFLQFLRMALSAGRGRLRS